MNNKVIITGYSFSISHLSKWVNSYPQKDQLILLIPKEWIGRGGRINFERENIAGVHKIYLKAFRADKYWPGLYFFKGFMPGFLFYALKNRPKVIYNGNEISLFYTLFTAVVSKLIGAKHICFIWENIPYKNKFKGLKLKAVEWVVRSSARLSSTVICGNKKAEEIVRLYGAKDTVIMPLGGIDMERFLLPRSNSAGITYLFSGELDKRKGVDDIAKAFKTVLLEIPDANLILIGSGKLEEELKSFIKTNDLSGRISIVPWVPNSDLPKYFSKADVFLYPSIVQKGWEEQFGFSLIEAMSSRLPVISTNSGSIPEVVPSGAGILIQPSDQEGLAKAMVELGLNPGLREKMGEIGQKWVSQNYSNVIIAERYFKIFNQ